MIWIYKTILGILYPFYRFYIMPKRVKSGKEHAERFAEKFGLTTSSVIFDRSQKPVLWMHAASVGESVSFLPLIKALDSDFHIVLTTGTTTSADVMEKRLPSSVIHQFAPLDFQPCVKRFLSRWQPDYCLFIESELWPNIIHESQKRGVILGMVNMRMSDASFSSWMRIETTFTKLLNGFQLILTQTKTLCEKLAPILTTPVVFAGNLKYVRNTPVISQADNITTRSLFQSTRLWMAASTHEGEERLLLEAQRAEKQKNAKKDIPNTMILAPRHPNRIQDVVELCKEKDLTYTLYTKWTQSPDLISADVFIIDVVGVLPLFYDISDFVFVGGSLKEGIGGHSILEPLFHEKPVVHGPYMSNFEEAVRDVSNMGAAKVVTTAQEIEAVLCNFYNESAYRQEWQKKAQLFSKTTELILPAVIQQLQDNVFSTMNRKEIP